MKDKNLNLSIIFSAISIANLILYIILSSVKVVESYYIGYLFFLGDLLAIWVPIIIEKLFKTKLNFVVVLSYQIFLFLSIVVGSIWKLYNFFEYYDMIVHFISGVLIVLISYSVISSSKNIKANLFWVLLISFSIAMMCGAVWEIWEFSCDGILGYNAQHTLGLSGRNAIMDTMLDIVCDFAGAILGCFGIVIFEKYIKKSSIKSAEK